MTPSDIEQHIRNLRSREAELEQLLSSGEVFADMGKFRRLSQEHSKLAALFADFDAWTAALRALAADHELLTAESDAEMRSLLEEEIGELSSKSAMLEDKIQLSLLPPDPNDAKNIIVGIKPAAGGDEAALFAGELYRAYLHYAESQGWKVEILDQSDTDLGGIKDVSFSLSGVDVYSKMKYESGVHRVQRVPETEAGGRIHTSTVTVAVMPEAEEVELDIKPEELRFDVFRSRPIPRREVRSFKKAPVSRHTSSVSAIHGPASNTRRPSPITTSLRNLITCIFRSPPAYGLQPAPDLPGYPPPHSANQTAEP